jgi:predicted outer membrane repeat protein
VGGDDLDDDSSYNLLGYHVTEPSVGNGNYMLGSTESADLESLGNYGGPTLTHAVMLNSPAIDGGNFYRVYTAGVDGALILSDQRRFERYVDGDDDQSPQVDIGAFEFNAPLVVSTAADEIDGDYSAGDLSLREAVDLAEVLDGVDTIEFAPGVEEIVITQGALDVESDLNIVGPGADQLTLSGGGSARVLSTGNLTGPTETISISGLTIADGYITGSGDLGAGLKNRANLTLDSVVFDNNESENGGGGAIYSANSSVTLTIRNSTFTDNHGSGHGGALRVHSGDAVIHNSTFSGNSATGYEGGAIYVTGSSTDVELINSTITLNSAWKGGGFWVHNGATLLAHNSIISGNSASYSAWDDGDGALEAASSYNVLGYINNGVSLPTGMGNQTGVSDPGLTALGDYGGAVPTHALLTGSDAIDAGDNSVALAYDLDFDQRGFDRFVDGDDDDDERVDIGAFELALGEDWGSV